MERWLNGDANEARGVESRRVRYPVLNGLLDRPGRYARKSQYSTIGTFTLTVIGNMGHVFLAYSEPRPVIPIFFFVLVLYWTLVVATTPYSAVDSDIYSIQP